VVQVEKSVGCVCADSNSVEQNDSWPKYAVSTWPYPVQRTRSPVKVHSHLIKMFLFAAMDVHLDKLWSDQELVYDYKADLHDLGNGSITY